MADPNTSRPVLEADATSGVDGRLPTYNAYSGDGDVTAELVYVNQGTPADYEELDRRGIDVRQGRPGGVGANAAHKMIGLALRPWRQCLSAFRIRDGASIGERTRIRRLFETGHSAAHRNRRAPVEVRHGGAQGLCIRMLRVV